MMRISTKTRYALRSLLEMACRNDKRQFTLRELAKNQKISRKYLEMIFNRLKKAGIVGSAKGKGGGFYFSCDLKDISLLQIFEALEGELDVVTCRRHGRRCERIPTCPARLVWKELTGTIKDYLAAKNLCNLTNNKEILRKCRVSLGRTGNSPR